VDRDDDRQTIMTAEAGVESRVVSIGLLWHSVNSGNLGVGALTIGNIALIRRAAASAGVTPRFVILGFSDPGDDHYVTGPDVTSAPIDTRALLPGGAFGRALRTLDCALDIGGGDSFADIYGLKRFTFLWYSKMRAILQRVPLGLSPQTIGPFTRQPQTAMAAMAMRGADFVVARDPLSFDVARQMAPRTPVLQSVDVAFALPYEPRAKADPAVVEVGLNVSGLLFNGGYSGANEFGMQVDYRDYTRRLIAELLKRPNVSVHLISHVNSEDFLTDDDGAVADLLAKEFPRAIRAPSFASPSEAKSYISGLDFLVGGRMHACIAAYSSGVPVVPIAYSRKFIGLFEGLLGYSHVVPVKGLDTEAALTFTLENFDRREALRSEVARGNALVQALIDAYCTKLTEFLRKVAQKSAR